MRYLVIFCAISTLLFSCKKDKLKGENAILIGNWTWTQSDHVYGYCDDLILSETITPSSSGQNFSMEIKEKGIIRYYKDGTYLEKDSKLLDRCTKDKKLRHHDHLHVQGYKPQFKTIVKSFKTVTP